MTELTKLMESLDNPHDNVTDNFQYQFSNSENITNNNTF